MRTPISRDDKDAPRLRAYYCDKTNKGIAEAGLSREEAQSARLAGFPVMTTALRGARRADKSTTAAPPRQERPPGRTSPPTSKSEALAPFVLAPRVTKARGGGLALRFILRSGSDERGHRCLSAAMHLLAARIELESQGERWTVRVDPRADEVRLEPETGSKEEARRAMAVLNKCATSFR